MFFADNGEHLVLDGFFENPLISAGLLQNLVVAVLHVDETQFALEPAGFLDRVTVTVEAMACIQAQTNIGM